MFVGFDLANVGDRLGAWVGLHCILRSRLMGVVKGFNL